MLKNSNFNVPVFSNTKHSRCLFFTIQLFTLFQGGKIWKKSFSLNLNGNELLT